MTKIKFVSALLCACMMFVSCNTSNLTKGTAIGGTAGAAVGALAGYFIGGKSGSGAAIGAAVGTAVGAGTGALIGNHMDKKKAAAEAAAAAANATVEETTDANGLKAYKFQFDENGIQFATNKADLNAAAKNNITAVANFLKANTDCDVAVFGHTDSTGSDAINNPLSEKRANSVSTYMQSIGVAATQIKCAQGKGSTEPVADNSTAAGRKQNRRVEVIVYPSAAMIKAAEAGTLQ